MNPIKVLKLTAGATYTCTVLAKNARGVGPASAPSSPVTLPDVPGRPTITNIDPSSTKLSISYELGSTDGKPITGVRAICRPSVGSEKRQSPETLADPLTVAISRNGGTYTCSIVAYNAVGRIRASKAYVADGSPGLITDLTAASYQDHQTTLSFSVPPDNGSVISQYQVRIDGVTQSAPLASDDTVALSQNGVTYILSIAACNSICGPWSNPVQALPDAPPAASDLQGSVTSGNVYNFSWDAPISNGCPVTEMGWSIDASGGPWNGVDLTAGGTSLAGNYGESHVLYLMVADSCGLMSVSSVTVTSELAYTYDNYSNQGKIGIPMCRGNPNYPMGRDLPGGTFSQSMTVPPGVGTMNHVTIEIDPVSTETASLTLTIDGNQVASAAPIASGDTQFSFPDVTVVPGDSVSIQVSLSDSGDPSSGQIVTIYEADQGFGTFTYSNSCAQDTKSGSSTSNTLRAVVSGWS